MSDVNEFNAETKELVLRSYTEEEIAEIERVSGLTTDVPKFVSMPGYENKMALAAKLVQLGLDPLEAQAIVGI